MSLMNSMRKLPWLLVGLLWGPVVPVQAAHTQARLILDASTVQPGTEVTAGVELKMDPSWHTYWRNGGDSGSPTKIKWSLPAGITAGETLWPIPEKQMAAGLTTYGYEHEVVLLVPLRIGADVSPGPQELKADVSWLECAELCLPGKQTIQATLTVGSERQGSAEADEIARWRKRLPVTDDVHGQAWWEKPGEANTRPMILAWSPPGEADTSDFYPYSSDDFLVRGDTERVGEGKDRVLLRKVVEKYTDTWPGTVRGIFLAKGAGEARAYEVTLAVLDNPPASTTQTAASRNVAEPPAGPGSGTSQSATVESPAPFSLWKMLGLAFLGGLILNFMPCVLPVIALKVLGFVNQSREEPERVRRLGIIYGLGVLASFLVLAGVVVGVQQAGKLASWGMQFQNPEFLVVMTILVTVVALNLFGVFEVTLGGNVMGAAGELAGREGASGAFFNGILATALATPCTAPYLALALGFAFSQSAAIIVLMFATIGLGLALPYVVLSFFPGLSRFLPKPGPWMEKFKVLMGFPLLATAVWLLTLTINHYGMSVLWLGFFLVFLALALWIWGQFVQRGRKRKGLAALCSVLVLGAAYGFALEDQMHWRSPRASGLAFRDYQEAGGIAWRPWSEAAVQQARLNGHPVFVDFTADWCTTCQVNKKTSIEIDPVREKLKDIDAVCLIGDYTREDDAITAELKKYRRAGVPLVLAFPAQTNAAPVVLPEVLTPGIVLRALEEVSGGGGPKVAENSAGS